MHSDPLCQIMRKLIDMIEKGAKSTGVEHLLNQQDFQSRLLGYAK